MHRNVFLLVAALAVIAALVVGVNLGRRQSEPITNSQQLTTPTPTPPTPKLLEYTNAYCGVSFQYPDSLTKVEGTSGSAILVNQAQAEQSVTLICQREIPPVSADVVDSLTLSDVSGASIAATLYRETATSAGMLSDKLIFRHPRTGLTVLLAGAGDVFQQIITTLKLTP